MQQLVNKSFLLFSLLGFAFTAVAQEEDSSFLTTLRVAGIADACQEMKIDFEIVFAPMVSAVSHPYRSYRWSVSRDEFGNPVIHALPPEEEMGWTPWERWSLKNNRPIRSAWILYPVKQPLKRDFINWYMLEVSENLYPRILTENVREEVAEQDVRMVTIAPEQVADAIWDARSQPDNNPNHYNREKKNN